MKFICENKFKIVKNIKKVRFEKKMLSALTDEVRIIQVSSVLIEKAF